MNNRIAGRTVGGLVLAMLAAGAWTLTQVPPDQLSPIHFDHGGSPDS
jgi:hypothetical protein